MVDVVFTNDDNIHCSIVPLVTIYNKTDKYNDCVNFYKDFRIFIWSLNTKIYLITYVNIMTICYQKYINY